MSESIVSAAEDIISVDDAIAKDNDGDTDTVEGYIVGYVISQKNVSRTDFNSDTNFAMANDPEETDIDKMVFVQVPGSFRDGFGLKSNPDNLDNAVQVTGDLEKYFGGNGLKDTTAIVFTSDDNETEDPLELMTIAEARVQGTGAAMVKGTVTARLKNTIHIQDKSGAIAVRPTSLDAQVGDEITVSGNLQDYHGLLQLNAAELEEKEAGVGVPDPVELTGEAVNQEENESKLVTVKDVTIEGTQNGEGWTNYVVTDGTEFLIRDENNSLDLSEGNYASITGIIQQFDDDYQMIPRDKSDVVEDTSVVQPVSASPNEGTIASGTEVELTTTTVDAEIIYTTDGSEPTEENGQVYEKPIVVDEDLTVKAVAKQEGLNPSKVSTFIYKVYDAEAGIQIHDIQGEGHESPMIDSVVNDVEGIVTYQYDIRGSNYFHIQSSEDKYDGDPKTSEGIVIYTGKAEDVAIGDRISVTGMVDEYYIDGYDEKAETDLPVTQINARDDQGGSIEVLESDVALPEPIKITSSDIPSEVIGENGFDDFEPENYAIDFWESMEGMRVEVAPSKAVAPQEHGDLVVATEEFETDTINGGIRLREKGPNAQSIQFKLYPNDEARDFAVKTGDMFTESMTGVVNYGFSNYKVYADLDEVEDVFVEGDTEPAPTDIAKDEDKLTVASYNVENFSANTSAGETPDDKAKNIARAFVQDMESPDIVGIIEVQDNNGQEEGPEDADASESYERLIDVIEEANGPRYAYVNIDPNYNEDGGAPHGNIRVGFLYNPARVSLAEAKDGAADEAVGYENGSLTLNPGRIAPLDEWFEGTRKPLATQFEFKGDSVVVVANHLNSKLGDDPVFGKNQPPELASEAQRMELARILNGFVQDVQADNPDENIIVLGDMNDFEFSNPLAALKGNELTDMIENVPEEKRYSYVYQGNSQVIDHVLVSDNLVEDADIDILHINADFTEMHGRASDHEPVLTQLDLAGGENADKEVGEKPSKPEEPGSGKDDVDKIIPVQNDDNDNTDNGIVGNQDAIGGSKLPITATNMYLSILIGSVLLIAGGTILIIRKRKLL